MRHPRPPPIRAVAGGEGIFSPAIAVRMVDYFANQGKLTEIDGTQPIPDVSQAVDAALDRLSYK